MHSLATENTGAAGGEASSVLSLGYSCGHRESSGKVGAAGGEVQIVSPSGLGLDSYNCLEVGKRKMKKGKLSVW